MTKCKTVQASDLLARESRITRSDQDTSVPESTDSKKAATEKKSSDVPHAHIKNKDFRRLLASQTVTSWCKWASMAGFIPVPALDIVTIAGIQTMMINELCTVYGVTFKKEAVSSVISSLLASGLGTVVSGKLATSLFSPVPIIGSTLGAVTLPVVAYATTFALGEVFIKHFELNGSIDDISVDRYDHFFKQKLAQAKEIFLKKNAVI